MTCTRLLEVLAERGVTLTLKGQQLHYRAPASALTDGLRAAIADHRSAIVNHLQTPSPQPSPPRCARCDLRDWVDEPPVEGRIRTHCGRCGRFIGYRPANLNATGRPALESSSIAR